MAFNFLSLLPVFCYCMYIYLYIYIYIFFNIHTPLDSLSVQLEMTESSPNVCTHHRFHSFSTTPNPVPSPHDPCKPHLFSVSLESEHISYKCGSASSDLCVWLNLLTLQALFTLAALGECAAPAHGWTAPSVCFSAFSWTDSWLLSSSWVP